MYMLNKVFNRKDTATADIIRIAFIKIEFNFTFF